MKKIMIIVPHPVVLQVVTGTCYAFETVNKMLEQEGNAPAFSVSLVGYQKQFSPDHQRFVIQADTLLQHAGQADLIIIPPAVGNPLDAIENNSAYFPWLKKQYSAGAEIASLCVGAFLLAATGLLNGRQCSTHWDFTALMAKQFPEVMVKDGAIVTEQDGLYTSGGANSFWNLLLHIIEKYTDRRTAITLAKYFALDIDRYSQTAYAIFRGQKNHDDALVKKAQNIIEDQLSEKVTVDELAHRLSIGRRSFERRFRQATSNSVLEYMQRVKMEAAKRNFEITNKQIGEVMLEVGYADPKAFRSVFERQTGLSPAAYRKKYNKMARQG